MPTAFWKVPPCLSSQGSRHAPKFHLSFHRPGRVSPICPAFIPFFVLVAWGPLTSFFCSEILSCFFSRFSPFSPIFSIYTFSAPPFLVTLLGSWFQPLFLSTRLFRTFTIQASAHCVFPPSPPVASYLFRGFYCVFLSLFFGDAFGVFSVLPLSFTLQYFFSFFFFLPILIF